MRRVRSLALWRVTLDAVRFAPKRRTLGADVGALERLLIAHMMGTPKLARGAKTLGRRGVTLTQQSRKRHSRRGYGLSIQHRATSLDAPNAAIKRIS